MQILHSSTKVFEHLDFGGCRGPLWMPGDNCVLFSVSLGQAQS